ncbi:MAG: ABC transporter permease subunit [Thermoleophilia bacterium]|nr:ABC transporter permease subunit [Thermoleophilia bacterium]
MSRPAPWRDVRVLRIAFQAAFLVAVVAFVLWIVDNTVGNLERRGIRTSFDFLDQPAGFRIPGSDFRTSQSIGDAILVGVETTMKVSAIGIVLAFLLGVFVGVARLSPNWLVRRAAALYVESLRNVPVLAIIFFWYLAVILRLPTVEVAGLFVFSNRAFAVPDLTLEDGIELFGIAALVGLVAAAVVWRWRTRRFDATGEPHHRVLWGAGLLAAVLTVGFFAAGRPIGLDTPERLRFGFAGGLRMSPEFAGLLIALVLYTASHIAEVVRGSILAVQKGQGEAADALGLSPFQRLRFVVLPQAFRIMIPPLANHFLNLVKNSSLGVAIALPEVTRVVRIAISQRAPAPQSIVMLMGIYLVFSLSIALVTNLVNRRLQLKGRT